jgi:PKD domain
MNVVRRRGLPALLGLALTVAAVAVATPAHAAGEPAATYRLDSTSIWTGQQVKLTESDLTADATVTRTIAWGDGTTTEAATAAVWSHTYATTGSYPVTVTLNDGTLSGPGTFPASSTVGVVTSPGTYGWKQPTVYVYPGYQNMATMTATGVPAAATQVWTGWGDGETSLLSGTTAAIAPHWFGAGTWTPSITLQNDQGAATPRAAGRLSVVNDQTKPKMSVTIPGSPHRASSWSQIKGKASDSQSGVDEVGVRLWRWKTSANVDYLFDFASRTWIKNGPNMPESTWAYLPAPGGNWHFYTSGLSKGWNFELDYYVMDKVGNHTGDDEAYLWYSLTS